LEQGTLTVQAVDVLRGEQVKVGAKLTIPFSRIADPAERIRRRFDQWNVLPLDAGSQLLFAANCTPTGVCEALAGQGVSSPTDPAVAELREAVQLQAFEGESDRRERLLEEALLKGKALLRRYALDAITVHGMVDRVAGVQILDRVIRSPQTTPDEKVELGFRVLDPALFQEERHADRANRLVVSLLVNALVTEPDPEHHVHWMQYLANTLLRSFSDDAAESARVKESLIRPIPKDLFERARDILMQRSVKGQPDEEAMAKDLLAVWLAAR
jgi:hypothetical protein